MLTSCDWTKERLIERKKGKVPKIEVLESVQSRGLIHISSGRHVGRMASNEVLIQGWVGSEEDLHPGETVEAGHGRCQQYFIDSGRREVCVLQEGLADED